MFTSSDSAGPSACPQSYTVRKIPLSAASSQLPHWSLEGGGAVRLSIQSAKTRRGADCGSDHDLLIAKFRLKLKKVEKTFHSKPPLPTTQEKTLHMDITDG